NNYNNFSGSFSYRIFEPTKTLNNFYISAWANYNRLYKPSTYATNTIGGSIEAVTKKILSYGANLSFGVGKQFNFFEPRTDGRYFIYENTLNMNAWISTNYNKKFAIDANVGYYTLFEDGRDFDNYWFGISPRFRFSDKLILSYSFNYDDYQGDRGFVTKVDDDIIFGERDQKIVINSISGNYNFNSFHGLTLTFRNYWSTVAYDDDLFTLQENGHLNPDSGYTTSNINDPDVNFNTWNLDFAYSWQFAPGSQLTALYRNQLFNQSSASADTYFDSLSNLFEQPIQHTFSLRMVYF